MNIALHGAAGEVAGSAYRVATDHARLLEETLERFRPVKLNQLISPEEGVTARFLGAGHMLGSASIQLGDGENGNVLTL